jgi:hypothetical protein
MLSMSDSKRFTFRFKRSEHPELYDYLCSIESGQASTLIRNMVMAGFERSGWAQLLGRQVVDELHAVAEQAVNQLSKAMEGAGGSRGKPLDSTLNRVVEQLNAVANRQDELQKQVEKMTAGQLRIEQELVELGSTIRRLDVGVRPGKGMEREPERQRENLDENNDNAREKKRRAMYAKGLDQLTNDL